MTLIQKLVNDFKYDEKEARAMVMAGKVFVNNEVIIVGSCKIKKTDVLRFKVTKKWVSRGALKLIKAINDFQVNVENKICLDIGSSTGGFTQVLLENKAKKVYALDSGTNQLDYSLRNSNKIVSLEQTNLKNINSSMFLEKIDIVTCDVSFISVKHVFNVLNLDLLNTNSEIIILIKPQFEANSWLVEKNGYVNEKEHKDIIDNIIKYGNSKGFKFIKIVKSPILGHKSKNIEYLANFRKV